jgi:hypothetical protein
MAIFLNKIIQQYDVFWPAKRYEQLRPYAAEFSTYLCVTRSAMRMQARAFVL